MQNCSVVLFCSQNASNGILMYNLLLKRMGLAAEVYKPLMLHGQDLTFLIDDAMFDLSGLFVYVGIEISTGFCFCLPATAVRSV